MGNTFLKGTWKKVNVTKLDWNSNSDHWFSASNLLLHIFLKWKVIYFTSSDFIELNVIKPPEMFYFLNYFMLSINIIKVIILNEEKDANKKAIKMSRNNFLTPSRHVRFQIHYWWIGINCLYKTNFITAVWTEWLKFLKFEMYKYVTLTSNHGNSKMFPV